MIKRFAAAACCALLLSTTAAAQSPASGAPEPVFPVAGQTWQYLDANPAGSWSAAAYSLGGREIKDDAQKQLFSMLDSGVRNGFSSVTELERGIISLVKLGRDPTAYQKNNLLSMLYTYENIYRDGLDGGVYALLAFQAAESAAAYAVVPETARNSIASVIDYLVSSQQREGGFSLTAGRTPDVLVTARVVTALATKRDMPYVAAAIGKALDWLGGEQNPDGSFSVKNAPSCEATAAVLTALRMAGFPDSDPRFVKDGGLLDGLESFQNIDGGYVSTRGESSSSAATERAVLALYTNATGLSPFLAPAQYPGYVEPEPDGIQIYLKFFAGFIAMLAVIYLILMVTTKIGKMWGDRPLPFFPPDPCAPEPPPSDGDGHGAGSDTRTMEINIPMKAELPDFDTIREQNMISRHDEDSGPQ